MQYDKCTSREGILYLLQSISIKHLPPGSRLTEDQIIEGIRNIAVEMKESGVPIRVFSGACEDYREQFKGKLNEEKLEICLMDCISGYLTLWDGKENEE